LAQQNGFGPAFLHSSLRWKAQESLACTQQSLTPAVDWLDSLIGPGGLLSVVSPPMCSPSFSLMGGVGKK
jgi:hypothetical protein